MDSIIPSCRFCGCTDRDWCSESCHWVEKDLCSNCVNYEKEFLELLSTEIQSKGAKTTGILQERIEQTILAFEDYYSVSIRSAYAATIHAVDKLFPNLDRNHVIWTVKRAFEIKAKWQMKLFDEINFSRANDFVALLNKWFFDQVAKGLQTGQRIVFELWDWTKYIITQNHSDHVTESAVDYTVDEGWRQCCSNCWRSIAKMKVHFNSTHLSIAIKAFEYSVKNNVQYVQVNDIGLTKQEYANMNRLVKFGLAFRNKDELIRGSNLWVYGIPRKRISDFLRGQWKVANFFIQDPLLSEGDEWKREMSEKRISVEEVPHIWTLRETLWHTLTAYEWNEQDSFE